MCAATARCGICCAPTSPTCCAISNRPATRSTGMARTTCWPGAASPTASPSPSAAAAACSAQARLRRGRPALLQLPLRAVRRAAGGAWRLCQRAGRHRLSAQQAAGAVHPLPAADFPALPLFGAAPWHDAIDPERAAAAASGRAARPARLPRIRSAALASWTNGRRRNERCCARSRPSTWA